MALTTSAADTRLLLTLEFPPSDDVKARVERLVQQELARKLLIPSIVLTELLKVAGPRIGSEAILTRIRILKSRGARIVPIDEQQALAAGNLLLRYSELPIADALVASLVTTRKAEYVVTNDPHFEAIKVKTAWL